MGNVFGHRHPRPSTTTPPPSTTVTIPDCFVSFRPRLHPYDVVDLYFDDSFSVVCAIDSFSSFDTEIGTITLQNPNPFTSFICEFTSLSTTTIEFYNLFVDHNVTCCMPSPKTNLVCFLNTMLQENERCEREIRYMKKLKLVGGYLYSGLVVCMLIYAMIRACWFNSFSDAAVSVAVLGVLGLWLARIGYFVDTYLGSQVRVLNAKQEVVVGITMFTRMILEGIDCVVTTGFQDLGLLKKCQQDIRSAKRRIFRKWKQLIDLEDD